MELPVEVPAAWQGPATLLFAITVIVATVIQYWRKVKQADPPPVPMDVKVLGAAFADAHALRAIAEAAETIAQTVKELRAIQDKESERGLQRWKEVAERLERIANALEASTGPPRRRG